MNYLAHAWLARQQSVLFRLGNLMADHIKGRGLPDDLWAELSDNEQSELRAGVLYHRQIDSVVDHMAETKMLKQAFRTEYRRYAGIVLDMAWDHILARQWHKYSGITLAGFAEAQYELLQDYSDLQPVPMRKMVHHMVRHNWLESYAILMGIEQALSGLSARLRFDNKLAESVSEIARLDAELSGYFPVVMDRLQQIPFYRQD
ncbi:ACP phosphodiesterase [Oceanospirillum sediminis]|uniref:DUF479 domain-containing protein n=1 Tax=Oceanospirillum sediminis TaxID=2760088 RepID=A0A839ISP6_9GAMM|nr:acyl carrier protein phosphodiesterase [Oceanospirillum sediminis]MBB1487457.1 DUF479 domain-containing protein [Oceanospirillum sediminis]